jgi:hypothetical protein
MGVDVDESGCEREPVGIYRPRRGLADSANLDDLSTGYRNVGVLARSAGPVNHHRILDDQVVCHVLQPPSLRQWFSICFVGRSNHNNPTPKRHIAK